MFTNRWFQGLWTQRNPLRDAGSTRIEEVFYGSRGDALIDGINVEVTNRLTLARRPGTSVFNTKSFPAIDAFYEFRLFSSNLESIKVMADTAGALYDATGPDTQKIIWTKSAGAGQTYMQSVGDSLFFGDGVDQEKWVLSALTWAPSISFAEGSFVVDTNNNLQLSIGSQTATITDIQIESGLCTIFFPPGAGLLLPEAGANITFAGMTTVSSLNGLTFLCQTGSNSAQIVFPITHVDVAYTAETGTATTGSGVSGATQPVWSTPLGVVTQDGGVQWVNRGSSVQLWGIVAPTTAPTVTQVAAPGAYELWEANTFYAPTFVIEDSNNNIELLTTSGTTGSSQPTWSMTTGATTADNTCVWTNQGSAIRIASHVYAVGTYIAVSWTYYITVPTFVNGRFINHTVPVSASAFFVCVTTGTSSSLPTANIGWASGLNTLTHDGTVVWRNIGGKTTWATYGAAAVLSLNTQILDSNGNVENVQVPGESGATAPTWSTVTGAYTVDNHVDWLNAGPFAVANTGAWIYAYSYGNSLTGHVSTASPESQSITVSLGNQAVIQGVGSDDLQVDIIYLWRTVQDGSILLFLDTIPNSGAGQTWIYTDITPDTGLNALIEAPIDHANDPPPAGIGALTYHLGSIWGRVGNIVYFSNGPNTTVGSGNESFPPANSFAFPDSVARLWPCTLGMVVFTNSQPYLISGTNTTGSPLISIPYLNNPGLLSYNAFDINGSVPNMMTSDLQLVSFDPSSGVTEVGFPIGDQFQKVTTGGFNTKLFTATNTYVAWYVQGDDKGFFVSDGATGWFKLCPTPAPESANGATWSPFSALANGCSAVQSVEVSPGIKNLLIGPKTAGPILKRDTTVFSDNGTAYNAYFTLGSLVLAQPGQYASVDFITMDSVKVGQPLTLQVQLDEIAPVSAGLFEPLTNWTHDLTELPNNVSLWAQRFYLSQTLEPAICRSIQILIEFGVDTVQNEVLSITAFGGFSQEK
jgi:hypothetical protein